MKLMLSRDERPARMEDLATQAHEWMSQRWPRTVRWTALGRDYHEKPIAKLADLVSVLRASRALTGRGPTAGVQPTYSIRCGGCLRGKEIVSFRLSFCLAAEAPAAADVLLEATMDDGGLAATMGSARTNLAATNRLEAAIRAFRPKWAVIGPERLIRARGYRETSPPVGWLTYLSKSLGPLPPIPPPTEVVDMDDIGWIIVAQPEPVDEANPEHRASLAYVRHALGARVLRDGPAFPPPAEAEAIAPLMALKEPNLVPAEVPSYLQAPSTMAKGTPAPIVSSAVPPGVTPLVAVTVDIDLSKILKSSVPFEPSPTEMPRSAVEGATRNPVARSGEPAVAAPVRAIGIEPPSPELPAPPLGKRWKRFDPQTGRPLSVPVLEDIPPTPLARPPEAPTDSISRPASRTTATDPAEAKKPVGYTETVELDPAFLAAALKQPVEPFRR